jgi:hypothetical protein
LKSEIDAAIFNISNLIDENGLDGQAYNVRRYQNLPHDANSTNVKRAENTKEFISNMLTQTDCLKKKKTEGIKSEVQIYLILNC